MVESAALVWAKRLGIPKEAQNVSTVQLKLEKPTVWAALEARPHGYRFLSFGQYARMGIDPTDNRLIEYNEYPKRVVDSWTLRVEPASLRELALKTYRAEIAKLKSKRKVVAPKMQVGYVTLLNRNEHNPKLGPRIAHYRLGIRFRFAPYGIRWPSDTIDFDAGDGQLLQIGLAPEFIEKP